MLHQFLKNLLNKKNITEVIILASVLLSNCLATPLQKIKDQEQNDKLKPGLYSSFSQLLEIENQLYQKKKERLQKKYSNLLDLSNINSVKLDTDFINHILFYSPSQYASLATKDSCAFYDLVEAGHIKDSSGEIQHFIVEYETRKGKRKTAIVSRATYMRQVAYKACPKVESFSKAFRPQNAKKVLKKTFLKVPSTLSECKEIHQNFIENHKTPYLCKIYEEVEKIKPLRLKVKLVPRSQFKRLTSLRTQLKIAQSYKQLLSVKSYDYLKNLCQNIEKPKMFCSDFFDSSFWKKIATGLKPRIHIENFCQELLNKNELKPRDIKSCARKLSSDESKCHYLNKFSHAITPKPSCKQISKALNFSRLKTDSKDCPYFTSNVGILNFSRISNHLKQKSSKTKVTNKDCKTEASHQFLKINMDINDAKYWGNSLCYKDKINDKTVCEPTLLGEHTDSEWSLDNVVSKILRKTRGLSRNQKCKVVDKNKYKPSLLEFKSGCWVIIDKSQCFTSYCKLLILNDEQKVTHINFQNKLIFPYFSDRYTADNSTQEKFLRTYYKKKTQKILNVSFLKNIFKTKPNSIIHGLGCREDLLPTFFQKRAINECSPLPFIVDGYFEEDGILSLVVRTAYDDLHAPRIIPWSYIFSAVKAYQSHNPINLWGLYALY